jgi:hypothetical protein
MNKKILLSITVMTAITVTNTAFSAPENTVQRIALEDPKIKSAGCAAGKCGGLKKFEEVSTEVNPQDQLVHARDGKCGVFGHSTKPTKPGKCASGLCGNAE